MVGPRIGYTLWVPVFSDFNVFEHRGLRFSRTKRTCVRYRVVKEGVHGLRIPRRLLRGSGVCDVRDSSHIRSGTGEWKIKNTPGVWTRSIGPCRFLSWHWTKEGVGEEGLEGWCEEETLLNIFNSNNIGTLKDIKKISRTRWLKVPKLRTQIFPVIEGDLTLVNFGVEV